jgi:hypothetical protein
LKSIIALFYLPHTPAIIAQPTREKNSRQNRISGIMLDVRESIALALDRTSIASVRNGASRETIALR